MEEQTKSLYVSLTPDEVATKAQQLATVIQGIVTVTDKAKDVAGDFREQRKLLSDEAKELAESVRSKKELREVDVIRSVNLPLRTWEVIRTDTKEIVESEAMTDLEVKERSQGKLFDIKSKMPAAEIGHDPVKAGGKKKPE